MSIMMGTPVGWPVHHAQHLLSAGFKETPEEKSGENQKSEVKPRRVIPGDGGLDHPRLALRRNKAQAAEDQFDDQRRDCHGDVKGSEQETGHLPPVILAI